MLIDLKTDEFHYDLFCYYPLLPVRTDRCDGSCNTVEETFSRICVPYKIEHVNSKVFNMIQRIKQ